MNKHGRWLDAFRCLSSHFAAETAEREKKGKFSSFIHVNVRAFHISARDLSRRINHVSGRLMRCWGRGRRGGRWLEIPSTLMQRISQLPRQSCAWKGESFDKQHMTRGLHAKLLRATCFLHEETSNIDLMEKEEQKLRLR